MSPWGESGVEQGGVMEGSVPLTHGTPLRLVGGFQFTAGCLESLWAIVCVKEVPSILLQARPGQSHAKTLPAPSVLS